MFPSFGGRFRSQDQDRQVWRPRRGSQPRAREASGHRPSLLRGTALKWAGRGRASEGNLVLGAPKKSARVAEATAPKPKIATTERRKASALRQGRAAARRKLLRLSALCPPRSRERRFRGDIRKKFRTARKPIPFVRNLDEAQQDENSMERSKPAPESDDMPEDIEDFRRGLIRRINNKLGEWRRCGDFDLPARPRLCGGKSGMLSQAHDADDSAAGNAREIQTQKGAGGTACPVRL